MVLNEAAQRVLGCLMEKEMTTPEQYPLSVNALVAASNQRSSRDPVMTLGEDDVRSALHRLQDFELVAPARDSARVPRYEHRIRTVLNLRRDETALLCLLLLRGAQTVGELRSRSDRMFPFDDLAQTQATLDRMAGRDDPLTAVMPRTPGSRETRYMHIIGSTPAQTAQVPPASLPTTPGAVSLSATEEIASLRERLDALERRLDVLEDRTAAG
jgi:uncharacterized protein YceH (UPF0502 family)